MWYKVLLRVITSLSSYEPLVVCHCYSVPHYLLALYQYRLVYFTTAWHVFRSMLASNSITWPLKPLNWAYPALVAQQTLRCILRFHAHTYTMYNSPAYLSMNTPWYACVKFCSVLLVPLCKIHLRIGKCVGYTFRAAYWKNALSTWRRSKHWCSLHKNLVLSICEQTYMFNIDVADDEL